MKCTEHEETPGMLGARMHVDESNVPPPGDGLRANVTVPVGLVGPVVVVSVTVAVQSEA